MLVDEMLVVWLSLDWVCIPVSCTGLYIPIEIISPKNVGFLKRQMNTLGREDLKKLVEEYEATFHNDQPDLDCEF